MSYYLRKQHIESNRPVFFFDIDQTFGASTDMYFLNTQENYDEICKRLNKEGLSLRFANDTMHLSKSSLTLFSELLKATNGVAICVSSWSSMSNPERSLTAIESIFSWFADFPENWLIGQTSGTGGDRYANNIKPIIDKFNLKNVAILDDDYKSYSNIELNALIDGRIGFNIYNLVEVVEIMNLKPDSFRSELAYHIKRILEEKACN